MAAFAESGKVGLKLIDLGNCFSLAGTDTSRISFEMQSLPFRAPEVFTILCVNQNTAHKCLCPIPITWAVAYGHMTSFLSPRQQLLLQVTRRGVNSRACS